MAIIGRFKRRGFLAFAGSAVAAAQTVQNSGGTGAAVAGGTISTQSAWFTGPGPVSAGPVAGQPYSAEQVTEQVQTLADGTHITQGVQKTLMYRDSAGRTRTEHIFSPPPGAVMAAGMPSMVQIMDPVAGYHYFLNAHDHTARRMSWPPVRDRAITTRASATIIPGLPAVISPANPPMPHIAAAGPAGANRPRPDVQRESLGTDTIEGITANGTRITTTYPEGSFGNDRPVTVVTESWFSPELKMMVLSKSNDPRMGESTTKLTNVSQSEPDPSLFQIPADYQIVDQQQPQ